MSERLTDVELDEAMDIAKSLRSLRLVAALAELRERRAADLTKFSADAVAVCNDDGKARRVYLSGNEMEALRDLGALWNARPANHLTGTERRALAVLSKLTKAGR